ncbi:hypothetical protein D3C72_421260 [compost metagenome]
MYRYEKVRQFIESIFRRFNVEFLPGATLSGLERPLLIRHEGIGKYLFFLPPGLVGAEKNEAVGIEVARLLLGQDDYRPRTEAERAVEAKERILVAAQLLIPWHVAKVAQRSKWTPRELAEEALVTEQMAATRMRLQSPSVFLNSSMQVRHPRSHVQMAKQRARQSC